MKNTFFLLLSIFVILIAGCNKDEPVEPCTDETNPECSNFNPCLDKEPTSADFETACVLASTAHTFIAVETDSFYLGSPVLFTAKEEDALSYEWTVGDDERVFTEREFSLNFYPSDSTSLFNRPIPIQLIVTRTPSTDCFPSDDGIDTITKNIYFISQFEQSHKQFRGTWVGSMENTPDDVYEIEIYEEPAPYANTWQSNYYLLVIKNLDNEGDHSCRYEIGAPTYNSFYDSNLWMQNYIECQRSSGVAPQAVFGKIDETGQLRIEWLQWIIATGETEDRVFNGRKK